MTASITRMTGKSVKTLMDNLTDHEKPNWRKYCLKSPIVFLILKQSMAPHSTYHMVYTGSTLIKNIFKNQDGAIQSVEKTLVLEIILRDCIGFRTLFREYQTLWLYLWKVTLDCWTLWLKHSSGLILMLNLRRSIKHLQTNWQVSKTQRWHRQG